MSLILKQNEILATFDKLVDSGEILFGPSKVTRIVDNGFPFEFRACPALQKKPLRPEDDAPDSPTNTKKSSYDKNATFGPGSDIKRGPLEFLIAKINDTHNLVFNKFCVYRAQYMLLTADSYQRQDANLTEHDLSAAWSALGAFDIGPKGHYLFYNCTSESGNSREHKHMQIFERPLADAEVNDDATNEERGFVLFPDSKDEKLRVPFQYFVEKLPLDEEPSADDLLAAYKRLLVDARKALGLGEEEERCPHNMVLVREWIMVIPRRKALVGDTTVNAAGMMGLVWATSDEDVEEWMELGPTKVLEEVGVPN